MLNIAEILKTLELKFKPSGMLFDLDILNALKQKICPFCGRKLYEMRNRPLWYCRAKTCECRGTNGRAFIVSKEKIARLSS